MHHISPGKYKTIWLVSMCSIISKHTYFLLKFDLHCNLPHFRNVSNTSGVQCAMTHLKSNLMLIKPYYFVNILTHKYLWPVAVTQLQVPQRRGCGMTTCPILSSSMSPATVSCLHQGPLLIAAHEDCSSQLLPALHPPNLQHHE